MAQGLAGWYPDPGGAPGRYRHWDGTQWSAETTDDPHRPPPAPTPQQRRSLAFWIVAVAAMLAVLTVIAVAVTTALHGIGPITAPPNPPPPNPPPPVVRGDDSSPTPTPTRATPTPTPSRSAKRSPSPTSSVPLVRCPLGIPNLQAPHPIDDRVYGGNLSFLREPTFQRPSDEPRLTFAWDVTEQIEYVDATPLWVAQLAVGQLRASDGFVHDARNTAESVAQCTLTGDLYQPYLPERTDRRSEAVTIDGRKGWLIEADINVTAPGLAFPGDRAIVVVVPDGKDWGMFLGAVPIGDADLNAVLDRAVAGLQVR